MIRENIMNYDYRLRSDYVEREACRVFDLTLNEQNRGRDAKGHGDAVDSNGYEVEVKSICPGSTSKYWCISHIRKSYDSGVERIVCRLETDDNVYWFDIFKDANPEAYNYIVAGVRDHATFYANLETIGNIEEQSYSSRGIHRRTELLLECLVCVEKK